MAHTLSLQCRCGKLTGTAREVSPETGNRVICLCDDCQAYLHHLGAKELLDQNGGTDIFQFAPSQVTLKDGIGHLQCLRLKPKGLTRWYAACCNTPVANSLGSPKVPFIGMPVVFMKAGPPKDEAIGPVLARVQGRFGKGALPPETHPRAPISLILRSLRLVARAKFKGMHSPSPFFDSNGRLVRTPRVLTPAEREKLRGL